ncbi:MAG: hypothetical protein ACOY90_11415 [Candidatus Zhuqueibacterota bacterium]
MNRGGSRRTAWPMLYAVALVLILGPFQGCSLVHHSVAALRSTDRFIPNEIDDRVFFEPGAEVIANKVALFLPSAVNRVEEKQFQRFADPVRVYVCVSRESFRKFYGADVRAGVLTKLFLSPRIFEFGDDIAEKYVTHELSHLHLLQHIGIFKMSRLPTWFKEGLATSVSDGGGAHLISPEQAVEAIHSGKNLVPNEADGLFIRKTPSDFGLEPHLFYRQSMMFVDYLAAIDAPAFRNLMLSVEQGERLSAAIDEAYHNNLDELWRGFLNEVKKKD